MRDLGKLLPQGTFLTCFPAGGGGKIRGAMLKRMGLQPGFPDLLLIYSGAPYGFELKAAKGSLTKAQIATHEALERAGMPVVTIRTLDDALSALAQWGIPLRTQSVFVGKWTTRRRMTYTREG